ncbi:phytanoyl-CoA dioxygenase family protein [Kitasatospora sp. NPDC127116]|uniref:phytanoyl-CoA dioxygenase family protein n=1 Tax=Kitasatospora sp. NPDC127116 TaxID=3345367 RepID=UPI003632E008
MTTPAPSRRLAADVRAHGHAAWPAFLGPAACAELRVLSEALAVGQHAHHYPKSTRVWDLFKHGDPFIDLLNNALLTTTLKDLLGENFLLSDYSLNMVQPGQPVDDWHIDYPYNEMPTMVSGSLLGLQCVLPLDPFHEANGATQLLSESHAAPHRAGPVGDHEPTIFEAEPGTLLVMAAATWHRSGFNASSSPRSAILLSFVERWVRPMSDPPGPGPWGRTETLRILLGMQRPPETINGVAI